MPRIVKILGVNTPAKVPSVPLDSGVSNLAFSLFSVLPFSFSQYPLIPIDAEICYLNLNVVKVKDELQVMPR